MQHCPPQLPTPGAWVWAPLQRLDSFSPPGRPGLKYPLGGLSADPSQEGRAGGARTQRPTHPTLPHGPLQRAEVTQGVRVVLLLLQPRTAWTVSEPFCFSMKRARIYLAAPLGGAGVQCSVPRAALCAHLPFTFTQYFVVK